MSVPGQRRVVDTNVISYVFKENSLGTLYRPHLAGHQLAYSIQALAELRVWALRAGWGERKMAALLGFLNAYALVYPDKAMIEWYAYARFHSLGVGINIDPADAWIAATALALRCPLVTHNARHYAGVPGLTLITENSA